MKHLFNHTFEVQRKTRVSDNQGGWSETYQTIGTVLGRLRPASASERTIASQDQARITHVFYCDTGEDIQRGDRIVLGDLNVEIIAIREPSYMGHHWECDGEAIQNG